MSKKIQDTALLVFIFSVFILTVVSILGIWDIFQEDVVYKSFTTIGILVFASLITVVAAKAMHAKQDVDSAPEATMPNNSNQY